MRKNRVAIGIGLFILGGGLVLALGIIFFGGDSMFSGRLPAVIFFDSSVAGLQPGAPVTFQGVVVGEVRHVALEVNIDRRSAHIPVYIEINSEDLSITDKTGETKPAAIAELVKQGLCAQLEMQSWVTGRLMINLDFDDKIPLSKTNRVGGIPEIPAKRSAIDRLVKGVSELDIGSILARIEQALETIEHFTVNANDEVVKVSSSLVKTSDDADRLVRTLQDTVVRLDSRIDATLEGIKALAGATSAQLSERGGQLEVLIKTARQATNAIRRTASDMNTLIQPQGQIARDLESSLRDLAATASSLRSFARQIERNPNALLLGSP